MIRAIELAADYEDFQIRVPSSARRTWVAVKPVSNCYLWRKRTETRSFIPAYQSALLSNPAALVHLSAHLSLLHARDPTPFPGCPRADDLAVLNLTDLPPGSPLSAQDLSDLRELREGLIRICTRARARNVRVIVDAEHSCYQVGSTCLLLLGLATLPLTFTPACSRRSIPFPLL
jgi:proline dehydrogenase